MKKIILLFVVLSLTFMSCSDEDDTRDINYELIIGKWTPDVIQVDLREVYAWENFCGDDFLLIENDSLGQFNLHTKDCTIYQKSNFTYTMKDLMLFITDQGTDSTYRRQVMKLTADELILQDPDDWRVNYIKYSKKN